MFMTNYYEFDSLFLRLSMCLLLDRFIIVSKCLIIIWSLMISYINMIDVHKT